MLPGFQKPIDVLDYLQGSKRTVLGVTDCQLFLGGKGSAFAARIEHANLSRNVYVTTGQKVICCTKYIYEIKLITS